ncbi:uracil-DNA glycosylase family protein [Candidatus Tisiphia endosymbiont of Micropterix aruncella]|uniref:uracil-DNA glycosylase family protein n=1 Tax=Candidatus Tisiphia endosymbiont of Micropterix aruncella TaxID=3066271 RepID=UPI003AA8EE57
MNKMTHFTQKINQLKWLQAIGIDYYLSESSSKQKILDILDSRHSSNNIKESGDKRSKYDETMSFCFSAESKEIDRKGTLEILDPCFRRDDIMVSRDDIKRSGNNIKEVQMPLRKTPTKSPVDSNSEEHSNIQLARDLADAASSLEELKKLLMDFNGCSLKKLANKTVFADGNPQSSIMFIGEAPGSNEDAQGIPFCGESGKLLDNVLASINISREHNAYITNTVFWRPPANRQPTQEEIDICRPFVEKHIALINPKLIVLVGNVAATSLLGKNAGISKIRQEYYLYTNQYLSKPIQTTSIFHPAYLLRQPMQKKTTWYDLLKIHEYINASGI